jgi:hypothetical protein
MVNFKELFQERNENKLIEFFKNKFSMMSSNQLNNLLNYKDDLGNTLLHHAHMNNCKKLAKLLYNNKVGINIPNNQGNVIVFTDSESMSSDSHSKYMSQSESEINQSFFSEKNIQQNGGGDVQSVIDATEKKTSESIGNIIKYTKNKKDMYIEKGKKLIKYTQDIPLDSKNIQNIGKMYNLNLDKPNDILIAKYKQAGLYDYVINKYPNLGEGDISKLIDFNIEKETLDKIDPIRIKNKIMKCFKSLKQ